MTVGTILILLAVLALGGLALREVVKNKKQGGCSGCPGGCGGSCCRGAGR